jgi:hypothetical protein
MDIYILKNSPYNEDILFDEGYATDEKGIEQIARSYAETLGIEILRIKIDMTKGEVEIWYDEDFPFCTLRIKKMSPVKGK